MRGWPPTRIVTLGLLLASALIARARPQEALRLVQTIQIPAIKGRIDHMDADVKGRRLFIAALENNSLEVADLGAGKWIRSIPGLKKPQGVAYIPSLKPRRHDRQYETATGGLG
jgi:hypothetical protein